MRESADISILGPMRGKIFMRLRQAHTFLGVFFSPLLLLFIATGWWQTFQDADNPKTDWFNTTLSKFSDIHTSDYWNKGGHPHSSEHFKILVAAMAVALIVTILMGLIIACQNRKKVGWAGLAFGLGIVVPVAVLYFN